MSGRRWHFSILVLALVAMPLLRADDVLSVTDQIARQHLRYIYGSEDLRNGGLDCSGFVQVVFREACGINLPDEADKQLDYVRAHGRVWDANSDWSPAALRPGDLIFFAGPDPLPRASLVTHVMIYCGHNTMAGAQGKGRQEDGVYSGIGYYYFRPRLPDGIVGESGERFVGHRRVFAYGRLNETPVQAPIATKPPNASTAAASVTTNSQVD